MTGLHDRSTDVADIRNLGAQVIMEQLQAIQHLVFFQFFDSLYDLCKAQAENTPVPTTFHPVATCLGGNLHTETDQGTNIHFFSAFDDKIKLAGHFNDEKTVESHFSRIQTQIHKLSVFVTVADQTSFSICKKRKRSDQFCLAARFKTMVIPRSELGNSFHYLLLLVYFDGINTSIFAFVSKFLHGGVKAVIQFADLRIQDVFDSKENRHIITAVNNSRQDMEQIDRHILVAGNRTDHHKSILRDIKIATAPVSNMVQLRGVFNAPSFHNGFLDQFVPLYMILFIKKFRLQSRQRTLKAG